jgi:hypothetical protein
VFVQPQPGAARASTSARVVLRTASGTRCRSFPLELDQVEGPQDIERHANRRTQAMETIRTMLTAEVAEFKRELGIV